MIGYECSVDGKQLTIGSNKKLEGSGTDNTIQVKHGQPSLLCEGANGTTSPLIWHRHRACSLYKLRASDSFRLCSCLLVNAAELKYICMKVYLYDTEAG